MRTATAQIDSLISERDAAQLEMERMMQDWPCRMNARKYATLKERVKSLNRQIQDARRDYTTDNGRVR